MSQDSSAPASGRSVLSFSSVQTRVSLGRTAIYAAVAAGTFPKPVKLGQRRVGWLSDEVDSWIDARADAREAA